jgi:hypothetical protein
MRLLMCLAVVLFVEYEPGCGRTILKFAWQLRIILNLFANWLLISFLLL